MDSGAYIGDELALFAHAQRWKAYWQSRIKPYVRGRVLEVGGGVGANTPFFATYASELTVLEPDAAMAKSIQHSHVLTQTILEIDGEFDAIFYIDVLEHIESDRAEVEAALAKLAVGGVLVVLAPAHQQLYSPFDKAIGHFRRYTISSLSALAPRHVKRAFYLDTVGYAASLANKLLLKQSLPTLSQIKLWDGLMVPLSRLIDRLCFYRLGKTVVVVFEKGDAHV
jgi:2-polyprenyl-3-methyl-5-hydroxy-6-metoxy-1,4-benzoquinol methylase